MKTLSISITSVIALLLTTLLFACSSGGDSSSSAVVVSGGVPIAYAKRVNSISTNPTNGAPTAPGGDLIIREVSSASAIEHNITAPFTQGQGDVNSLDVSYDGTKIVFAMRCPVTNTSTIGGVAACTGRFNIWEYDMTTGGLTGGSFRRITSSASSDDVEATYLPGGAGFVFTSNRQTESSLNEALGYSYFALDEYERERVFNLHTMANDGSNIQQISFNQSHDRAPTVRPNGVIMFSRWDHLAGRNHFKVFTVNPDGTNLFVLYGPHSDGISFLHPRDMDPAGPHAGYLATDLMPLDRTQEGGALMFVNALDYSDESSPINPSVPATGGQVQATQQALNYNTGFSQYGRITTPYPLWDGTDRILMAYTPCEVNNAGVEVSCATLTSAQVTDLSNQNRLVAQIQADPLQMNVNASYSIYMFDPATQTLLNVASPPSGFMYTHPVAIMARTEPSVFSPTVPDAALAQQKMGTLDVRSVYDTDALGRMSASVLAAPDLVSGCTTAIALTPPTDPSDNRPLVADLIHIKDPANPDYLCAPALFIRAVRAVAPPSDTTGMRTAIGDTEFEMQQILGYAPIQPDGSFKLTVPADTPIALAVIDAQGRAFQTHTNWIQVRPGELRTCDGCHSPRRGAALNTGAVANYVPAAWLPAMQSAHQSGETMAETNTRLNPAALLLTTDPVTTDIWAANPAQARPSLAIRYTGNTNSADDLVTPVPTNGIINYPIHIQPIWSLPRGASGVNTCTNCHNSSDATLNLTSTIGGSGRMTSYDQLMIGAPLLNASGQPQTTVDEGVLVIQLQDALVNTSADENVALGLARSSRLMEIMAGQTLMTDSLAQTEHPTPVSPAPDHSTMLNVGEKRLIAEWIDTGGKYYNDPFNAQSGIIAVNGLSEATFEAQVYPIILSTCYVGCHQAIGSTATGQPALGTSFRNNRYVLTGDPDGDYQVTLTMITNTCIPASNYLLSKPSVIHPAGAVGGKVILPVGSSGYNTISNWIAGGCP
jgi:hypothetical protein